jgi:hypothetical protein
MNLLPDNINGYSHAGEEMRYYAARIISLTGLSCPPWWPASRGLTHGPPERSGVLQLDGLLAVYDRRVLKEYLWRKPLQHLKLPFLKNFQKNRATVVGPALMSR